MGRYGDVKPGEVGTIRNTSMPKKAKPKIVKRAAPAGKPDLIQRAQAPPRSSITNAAPPEQPQAMTPDVMQTIARLKSADPQFLQQRMEALKQLAPPQPPTMTAAVPDAGGPPQAGPPLPPWAVAKGVTPDQYQSFLQRNPNAPGNRMGQQPGGPQSINGGGLIAPPSGGIRAMPGPPVGQPMPGGPQVNPIPGAGPNVQALVAQGVDPQLIQQRMRLAAAPPQPTVQPNVTM